MPQGLSAGKVGRLAARAVLIAAAIAVVGPPAAHGAASVAYVDRGEVWLSSLDGTRKARLAAPVVNAQGETENWIDVAQSDGGRIVAVRNKPGRISSFSWFKIWEPDGTSTVEGPLNAPSGWAIYVYPLGFDITADGRHLVYGYSNSGFCCPSSFAQGTYVRPATNSTLPPINLSGQTHPSLLGSRIVSLDGSLSPSTVNTQDPGTGNPYNSEFTGWLDASGVGLELEGVDVAATGSLAALGFQAYSGSTQTVGKIAVLAIQGIDQAPTFPAAVDCFVPAAGLAREASLAPDAGTIAWRDDGGVKVAGTPTTAADPCVMRSTPVVLSASGTHPSIGGADVAAFLPRSTGTPGTGGTGGTGGGGAGTPVVPGTTGPLAPLATLPARVKAAALAAARGVPVKVKVGGPGVVTVTGTVPARTLGRRGKPVIVAKGRRSAPAAGTVTVRLKLTAAARKRVRRLKGARLTLRIAQGSRRSTKVVTLR